MHTLLLTFCATLIVIPLPGGCEDTQEAFFKVQNNDQGYTFTYQKGNDTKNNAIEYVARAYCDNDITRTGWASLTVESNGKYSSHLQAYYAGFLETNLTYELTHAHYWNTYGLLKQKYSQDPLVLKLKEILQKNTQYMLDTSIKKKMEPFWYSVYLHLWQIRGMQDAFAQKDYVSSSTDLNDKYLEQLNKDILGVYILQLSSDIWTLLRVLAPEFRSSGLIRIFERTPDPSNTLFFKLEKNDVIIGHVTALPYSTMLRILKRYEFPWKLTDQEEKAVPGKTIAFSSYPSVTFSSDDFYVTNQKLVVSDTTLILPNDLLYKEVLRNTGCKLFTFIRTMVANRLAKTSADWVHYFGQENSGTANNEWLIYDSKKFQDGVLKDNALILLDQLPDDIKEIDVTEELTKYKYFGSFNIPYHPYVYKVSGLLKKEQEFGDGFYEYKRTTRYKLFEEWHENVTDVVSMVEFMRYNNFKSDPLSMVTESHAPTATKAIATRRDLNPEGIFKDKNYRFYLSGATDVKAVDNLLIEKLEMLAACGPTFEFLPAFTWKDISQHHLEDIPHEHKMHPETFNFSTTVSTLDVFLPRKQQP